MIAAMFTCTRVATGQEDGPGKNSSRSWKGHRVLFRVRKNDFLKKSQRKLK